MQRIIMIVTPITLLSSQRQNLLYFFIVCNALAILLCADQLLINCGSCFPSISPQLNLTLLPKRMWILCDDPSGKDVKCIEEGTGGACTDDQWAECTKECASGCVCVSSQPHRHANTKIRTYTNEILTYTHTRAPPPYETNECASGCGCGRPKYKKYTHKHTHT